MYYLAVAVFRIPLSETFCFHLFHFDSLIGRAFKLEK